MTDYSDEEQRILSYLRENAARGERYFRAKNIAQAIGLSSKQVGVRLPTSPKSPTRSTSKSGAAPVRRPGK